jgi:ribosomal protein S18
MRSIHLQCTVTVSKYPATVGAHYPSITLFSTMFALRASVKTCVRLSIPRIAVDGGTTQNLARYFSKDGDNGKATPDDDPFGLSFEAGSEPGKLGSTLPPKYKRDPVTAKFTGEKEKEFTAEEKKLLKMDPVEEQEYLLQKVYDDWDLSSKTPESGMPTKLSELAKRIREDNMGLNTLGRSVEAQSMKPQLEDGEDGYIDKAGFSKPLSPSEFNVFKKHMKEEYDMEIDEADIPVEPTGRGSVLDGYADNDYLNKKWLSSRAVRFMDDSKDDDPFSDLLPSDFSPSKLVSRRQAKKIPRELLHHNNLALLRRYITPTGQIMSRVQSRLGAKDQRKVATLIKRARALGLLPTAGQFVIESHGSIHETDIGQNRDWEDELERRGLVLRKKQAK